MQWSQKSEQSMAFGFTREYKNISYKCRRCQADCVFTAQGQQL
jgi:hypothetical protein